ncbi:MAG: hypothetical protein HYY13_13110 [Nitrospirae bacterium]|nr:hypothetical protein [Nitrospirota bacterium]
MKRVTILVPDTIRLTQGGFRSSRTCDVPVSGEAITNALEIVDYHEQYSFAQGSVFVEQIEELDVGAGDENMKLWEQLEKKASDSRFVPSRPDNPSATRKT